MYDDILLPTDGSTAAEHALSAVTPIAEQYDATVHLLTAFDLSEVTPSLREQARSQLHDHGTAAIERLAATASQLESEMAVIETMQPVHEAILEYAEDHEIDLIAMGTHNPGTLRRFTMGSVTRRTVRSSDCPVLVVGEDTTVSANPQGILLPTDGSAAAAGSATHALELCEAFEATLHVINVVDLTGPWSTIESSDLLLAFEAAGKQAVDAIIERADDRDIASVQTSVISGYPAESIVDYVEQRPIDLVVMGTHGRSGIERALLGSVTEAVIGNAAVPVFTVKQTDSIESAE